MISSSVNVGKYRVEKITPLGTACMVCRHIVSLLILQSMVDVVSSVYLLASAQKGLSCPHVPC